MRFQRFDENDKNANENKKKGNLASCESEY